MASHPDARPEQAPPGLRVGNYAVLMRLGEGGMGVVHLAERPDGHRVALKVLRLHIVGDDEARQRLAREVSSLGRVRSRWVAEVLDADPWAEIPYVATRYVPGPSLHDHVREHGPMRAEELPWFAGRLADGIRAVHAVGVLHRDIKPSNVLLEGRAPILIDFGLARVADDPRLTHTGWLLGTPGYLAPEILYGEDATTASDIHSWAATVAFAAIGRAPFGRGPAMAIMDRVRRGEHENLDALPRPLHAVVHDALDPDPRGRPSLEEILERLGGSPTMERDGPLEGSTMTLPIALASEARLPTVVQPLDAPAADAGTATLVDVPTRQVTEALPAAPRPAPPPAPMPAPMPGPPPQPAPPQHPVQPPEHQPGQHPLAPAQAPRKPSLAMRFRRSTLALALLVLAAVTFGLAPYLTTASLALLAWLLRAGSLAASGHQWRRQRRGPKWYDAVLLAFAYPWCLLAALPGSMLLMFWAGGLALAAALLAFAAAAPLEGALVGIGATFTAATWWGPGGSRFRRPVQRAVHPLAGNPWAWLVASGCVFIIAAAAGWALGENGSVWTPAADGPLAPGSLLPRLFGR